MLAVFTLACSDTAPPVGAVGHVREYFGGAAADEPEAVLVARDVLSAGGNAVDAVVAMGMTMMVTRPDAAGPGGGGMCVAFDPKSGKGEAIEFLARAPKTSAVDGRWRAAVPGSFRGLFSLHARYGSLPWGQLVIPAEHKARFGVRVPRVVTRAMAEVGKTAIKDAQGRAIFFGADGANLREGDALRQVDLAVTLSRIRVAGPGDFYSGYLAKKFVEGVNRAGGWLSIEDLRDYRPKWMKALSGSFGPHKVYFLPSPASGGVIASQIWGVFDGKGFFSGVFGKEGDAQIASDFVETSRRGYAASLTRPTYQTTRISVGALAVDRLGGSAACVLTMDRPFGSGRVAGDTGVIPVESPRASSLLAVSAMIVANENTKQTFLAATGAGDQFSSSAMMGVVLRVLNGKIGAETAMQAARISGTAVTGGVLVEPNTPAAVKSALGLSPRQIMEVPRIGLVNIMSCPEGVVALPDSCVVKSDPRGFGHAINAEF